MLSRQLSEYHKCVSLKGYRLVSLNLEDHRILKLSEDKLFITVVGVM